jgi:hypothetical protein
MDKWRPFGSNNGKGVERVRAVTYEPKGGA